MFITGLGTATPAKSYLQTECWQAMRATRQYEQLAPKSRALLEKVGLGNNGIVSRRFAVDDLDEAFALNPDVLHARFAKHAPLLATQACECALREAGTPPDQIDAVIVSTCTGYLCPGLTSYVSERLGLRADVLTLDLVGQGCGAALPNLRAGEGLLTAGRAERVLSVCVEVCSAAFYLDDDPGVLISACLFGDAAGAAVLAKEPGGGTRRVEWLATGSVLNPADRDLLRFETKGGMLRNILTTAVPVRAAQYAETVLKGVLEKSGVPREQIQTWVWHAGGRDVLLALRERLGLEERTMRWSAAVLRELGNVSSASVYHVLQRSLMGGEPGGYWWMSSFGAGFSCHGALLRVD